MKTSFILILNLFIFRCTTLYAYTQAPISQDVLVIATGAMATQETVTTSDSRTHQPKRRENKQPREPKLFIQLYKLDGLTEDQQARINELQTSHQEQIAELRASVRGNQITREKARTQHRALTMELQDQLKEALTQDQLKQLQKMRAEQRR